MTLVLASIRQSGMLPDSYRKTLMLSQKLFRLVSVSMLLGALVLPVLSLSRPAAAAEEGGFFQVFCSADHRLADDPIVYPGQPSASHMHTFFGNTSTNAASTTASLTSAPSSCGREMQSTDHSAYWVPSLYQKQAD